MQRWTGQRWGVSIGHGGQPTIAEQRDTDLNEARAAALENPLVQAVMATFPGARIVDIRTPETITAEAAQTALPEVEDEWDPFEED